MQKYVLGALLVVFGSTACIAAEPFYVAQEPTTKICKVQSEKPDGTKMVMVGTSSYQTKKQAKDARSAAPECLNK